jgi:hypothetical protein
MNGLTRNRAWQVIPGQSSSRPSQASLGYVLIALWGECHRRSVVIYSYYSSSPRSRWSRRGFQRASTCTR